MTRDYTASASANVSTTTGDATLSVSDRTGQDPGHLVNGTVRLAQPLQARADNGMYGNVSTAPLNLLTYDGPVSNDAVTLGFTLSTTSP